LGFAHYQRFASLFSPYFCINLKRVVAACLQLFLPLLSLDSAGFAVKTYFSKKIYASKSKGKGRGRDKESHLAAKSLNLGIGTRNNIIVSRQ